MPSSLWQFVPTNFANLFSLIIAIWSFNSFSKPGDPLSHSFGIVYSYYILHTIFDIRRNMNILSWEIIYPFSCFLSLSNIIRDLQNQCPSVEARSIDYVYEHGHNRRAIPYPWSIKCKGFLERQHRAEKAVNHRGIQALHTLEYLSTKEKFFGRAGIQTRDSLVSRQ